MKRITLRLIMVLLLITLILSIQSGCAKQTAVLVYDDSYSFMGFSQEALDSLSIGYTLTTNYNDFRTAFTSGAWDMVVFDNPYWGLPGDILDLLQDYAARGGKLVMSTWMPAVNNTHGLWAQLGYSFSTAFADLTDVDKLFEDEWLLNNPYATPDLEFGSLSDMYYGVDGFPGSVVGDGRIIASFDGSVAYNMGAVIWANSGRTILNAFLLADGYDYDGGEPIDADGDGMADATEWWADEISYLSTRPGSKIQPSASSLSISSFEELGNNAK